MNLQRTGRRPALLLQKGKGRDPNLVQSDVAASDREPPPTASEKIKKLQVLENLLVLRIEKQNGKCS